MKILLTLFGIFLYLFTSGQNVEPAPPDKAVVYFVHTSYEAARKKFIYFDSTQVIGTFDSPKFFRHFCDPGHHIFWAKADNRDFVRANLEAGKIYIIDVNPSSVPGSSRVKLVPVNSADYKLKKIQKLIAENSTERFSISELNAYQRVLSDEINRGMERLKKENYSLIPVLGSYSLEPEDFIFVKKKK